MAGVLFLLKKVVSRFFFPLPLVIGMLALAVWSKRWRRPLVAAAAVLLFLFSCPPFGHLLLLPLEGRFEAVNEKSLNRSVQWIVVLSGGSRDHQKLTPEDRLGGETLKRLLEGVRLSRLLPEARLVLSGGHYQGLTPDALLMEQVALAYGVPRERILLEADSWDTADEARLLRERLGQAPFYLVTTASHMPRAMRIFSRAGSRPLPAPTDFHALWTGPVNVMTFVPHASALRNTETAVYEYLGLGWDLFLATVGR